MTKHNPSLLQLTFYFYFEIGLWLTDFFRLDEGEELLDDPELKEFHSKMIHAKTLFRYPQTNMIRPNYVLDEFKRN